MPWLLPGIAIAIVIGSIGSIAAWIIGPTKGLLIAAQEDNLPKIFGKTNKKGVPVPVLIVQGVVVSILSLSYILLPDAQTAYFILLQLTTILALLMYVLMFAAGIYLRYTRADVVRPYKVPGGNIGMWIVGLLGGITSIIAMVCAFVPPSQISTGNPVVFKLMLIVGVAVFCLPAFFIHKRKRARSS